MVLIIYWLLVEILMIMGIGGSFKKLLYLEIISFLKIMFFIIYCYISSEECGIVRELGVWGI